MIKIPRVPRLGLDRQKKLISDSNNIASYTASHNSTNVLHRRTSAMSVTDRVCLNSEKVKGHACRYFETMGECINPALYAHVVIDRVTFEVIEF